MSAAIKITITKEDLENANKESENALNYCRSCLIFQAAKRKGLEPTVCHISRIYCRNNKTFDIDQAGREITCSTAKNWGRFVGTEFFITPSKE